MATTRKDLGPVTAYAIAVANGFTGTEAEWTAMIANASTAAQDAAQSAQEAAQSAQETADLVEDAKSQYGSPLKAETAAEMTDTAHIYVYTGSETGYTAGNWYYHDGSAWVSGGVYNATAVSTDKTLSVEDMAADSKVVGGKIADLKSDLNDIFSDEAKTALLACLRNLAWATDQGQSYYDALEAALQSSAYPKITAVFNPGYHIVYTSASLDSMKDYLTVTYYAERGGAGVVLADSAYTLSGTLSAGDSTITVSYNTLTTTFIVEAEQSGVPAGYTVYDYIRPKTKTETSVYDSSYSGQGQGKIASVDPRILTPTYADLNALSLDVDMYIPEVFSSTSWLAVLGGRSATGNTHSYAIYLHANGNDASVYTHGANAPFSADLITEKMHSFKIVNGTATPSKFYIDGVSHDVEWVNTNVINHAVCLFFNPTPTQTDTYITTMAWLSRMIFKNTSGNIVSRLIPCVRDSDGVIGMYDSVLQTFVTSNVASYATQNNSNCIYVVGNW